MDMIADVSIDNSNEWVFIACFFTLLYVTFTRAQFSSELVILRKSLFSKKFSNQLLRESSLTNSKLILLPVFICLFSLILCHPSQSLASEYVFGDFLKSVSILTIFFLGKHLLILFLAKVFNKEALFEEIHYQTFVFERLLGLTIFPLVLLAIYSPFNPTLIIEMVLIFVAAVLLFKWLRMLYLSFFSLTISKTHIIVYLCALEFLPLLIMLKIMHKV